MSSTARHRSGQSCLSPSTNSWDRIGPLACVGGGSPTRSLSTAANQIRPGTEQRGPGCGRTAVTCWVDTRVQVIGMSCRFGAKHMSVLISNVAGDRASVRARSPMLIAEANLSAR
jgi:hypothetical protein